MFTNKSIPETLSTAGPQPLKELPEAQHLLSQFGLNVPSLGTPDPLPAISTALLEFITMAPSLIPLHSDILKALFVTLNAAITSQAQAQDEAKKGPQTATQDHMSKPAELIERQETQCDRLENILNAINHTKVAVNNSVGNLDSAVNQAHTALQEATAHPALGTATATQLSTYANALKNGTPSQHAEILAQSEAQSHQVIIKCDTEDLYDLSEKELVAKANLAIENLLNQGSDVPMGAKFLSARKLTRLRICLKLNSQQNADWLRKKDNQETFLQNFGANTSFIDNTFRAVVEFIPITLDPTAQTSIRGVEHASSPTNPSNPSNGHLQFT